MPIAEYTVNRLGDLIETSTKLLQTLHTVELWFRGQPSTKYNLLPAIHRPHNHYNHDIEVQMSAAFMGGAYVRLNNCPDRTDYPSWLCLMQHFGVPTRLLDWSKSALIAAFFAVYQSTNDDACVWAISPGGLNAAKLKGLDLPLDHARRVWPMGLAAKEEPLRSLFRAAFAEGVTVPQAINLLAVVHDHIDPRMDAQMGCFTIHATNEPLESIDFLHDQIAKIIIPSSKKPQIIDELRVCGITYGRLFPDLAGLAYDVKLHGDKMAQLRMNTR